MKVLFHPGKVTCSKLKSLAGLLDDILPMSHLPYMFLGENNPACFNCFWLFSYTISHQLVQFWKDIFNPWNLEETVGSVPQCLLPTDHFSRVLGRWNPRPPPQQLQSRTQMVKSITTLASVRCHYCSHSQVSTTDFQPFGLSYWDSRLSLICRIWKWEYRAQGLLGNIFSARSGPVCWKWKQY